MQSQLLSIGQAAELLGVSIDTLRRWDAAGRLRSIRSGPKGHRFYNRQDIENYLQEIEAVASVWAESPQVVALNPDSYCHSRDVFQARLEKLLSDLSKILSVEASSLITAIAGEIGNNSFDHNLGNWPDVPGIFFSYAIRNRKVVLADRGQGILHTLKKVRPELTSSGEALRVAFTETISGRYPESRGNGLKFVKSVVVRNPFSLHLKTGDAEVYLKEGDKELHIQQTAGVIRGCFAVINFEESL